MKSVGEAMAIGRTIPRIRPERRSASLETGLSGFDEIAIEGVTSDQTDDERKRAVIAALQPADPRPPEGHRPGHARRTD